MGYKAPAFSNDATSISLTRGVNQSFGLLCQAQAFPVPRIRLVNCLSPKVVFICFSIFVLCFRLGIVQNPLDLRHRLWLARPKVLRLSMRYIAVSVCCVKRKRFPCQSLGKHRWLFCLSSYFCFEYIDLWIGWEYRGNLL